jgi:hypothetical protein
MSKLMLICECGQEMTVPDSALGRRGLCPECGKELLIGDKNTMPWQPRARRPPAPRPAAPAQAPEQAWRRFAEAVDLYSANRFAEALAVLNQLRIEFPEDQSIQDAQRQCMDALERLAVPAPDAAAMEEAELSPDLVRKVILDKMLRGKTEAVQLQAAELAARLMGMFPAVQTLLPDEGRPPVMLPQEAAPEKTLLPERLARDEGAAQPPMASAEEVRQLTEMLNAISSLHHPQPKNGGVTATQPTEPAAEDGTAASSNSNGTVAQGGRRPRSTAKSRRKAIRPENSQRL